MHTGICDHDGLPLFQTNFQIRKRATDCDHTIALGGAKMGMPHDSPLTKVQRECVFFESSKN